MINIFFDLDGTILDCSERLYSLFCYLVPESNLSKEEYWNLKRNKINHRMILSLKFNYTEKQINNFESRWMNLIESDKYLSKDVVCPEIIKILIKLKSRYKLYLITARQSIVNTKKELKRLNLYNVFNDIFITEHNRLKEELIREKVSNLSPNDIIVGDTGYDIQAGKILGIKTFAVANGFLSYEILEKYNPDRLFKDNKSLKCLI